MSVMQSRFGVTDDNLDVDLFTLRNTLGIEVRATSFGAILVSIRAPNGEGQLGDIVLGYDTLQPYLHQTSYFGAVVGRYANRIAHGSIVLDRTFHQLTQNDRGHHLHGGFRGFDKRLWTATAVAGPNPGVEFSRVSPDGRKVIRARSRSQSFTRPRQRPRRPWSTLRNIRTSISQMTSGLQGSSITHFGLRGTPTPQSTRISSRWETFVLCSEHRSISPCRRRSASTWRTNSFGMARGTIITGSCGAHLVNCGWPLASSRPKAGDRWRSSRLSRESRCTPETCSTGASSASAVFDTSGGPVSALKHSTPLIARIRRASHPSS